MLRANVFSELTAFAAVARTGSFRRAAALLNLRPSTLSHAVSSLEERLGVKVLSRTTRTVAPTDAGRALLTEVGPALDALDGALDVVNPFRERPRGVVRLTLPQGAASMFLAPRLGAFARSFPDIVLDAIVDDGLVDVVRDGFDAGIRLGEGIADGMTSIRIGQELRGAVVAAPGYWDERGRPSVPRDLGGHRCVNRRYALGRGTHRWRFERGGERVEVACEGPLIVNSEALMRRAAIDGVGVAFLAEVEVADDLAAGRLERVLEEWCPPMFAFFLYHPSQRLASAGLRALIDTLTATES